MRIREGEAFKICTSVTEETGFCLFDYPAIEEGHDLCAGTADGYQEGAEAPSCVVCRILFTGLGGKGL